MSNVPWVNAGSETDPCCCEPAFCCLYPAIGLLDGIYSDADLPDIIIFANDTGGPLAYNKIPPEPAGGVIGYYLAEGSPPIGSGEENIVGTSDDVESWIRWTGGSIGGPGTCLINSPPTTFADDFEDDFPDVLNVAGLGLGTREPELNLCLWSGDGIVLQYNSITCKYVLNGTSKDDPQSSPLGNYGGIVVS